MLTLVKGLDAEHPDAAKTVPVRGHPDAAKTVPVRGHPDAMKTVPKMTFVIVVKQANL